MCFSSELGFVRCWLWGCIATASVVTTVSHTILAKTKQTLTEENKDDFSVRFSVVGVWKQSLNVARICSKPCQQHETFFFISTREPSPRLPTSTSNPVGRNRFDLSERRSFRKSDGWKWMKCFCLTLWVHAGLEGGSWWQRVLLPGLSWSALAFMYHFSRSKQANTKQSEEELNGMWFLKSGYFFFVKRQISLNQSHFQPFGVGGFQYLDHNDKFLAETPQAISSYSKG